VVLGRIPSEFFSFSCQFSFSNHPATQICVDSIITMSLSRTESSRLGFQRTCLYIPEDGTPAVLFSQHSRHKILKSIQNYYSRFVENRNFILALI
jgi:hypothetical protein